MSKLLKVTISGSYHVSTGEIVDFENVTGTIPFAEEDKAEQYIIKRFSVLWVKAAKDKDGNKLYPKRIDKMRQVFVDKTVDAEGELSFIGKDIKEMSYDELQDLAIAKDLNRIPRPKEISGVSLRDMRIMAYVSYADKVLNKDIKYKDQGFNFAKLNPLVVDGYSRREDATKITNDEIIEKEQETPLTNVEEIKSSLTLEDLKGIAKEKNINFHPAIGFDKLHAKLYG